MVDPFNRHTSANQDTVDSLARVSSSSENIDMDRKMAQDSIA